MSESLRHRPTRPPDHEAESRALRALSGALAIDPAGVLRHAAALVLELCDADSAAIGVFTDGVERWHVTAGDLGTTSNIMLSRETSPTGAARAGGGVLLIEDTSSAVPELRTIEPPIFESLLATWPVEGQAAGTLWALKHAPDGQFDAEDARVLQSLAQCAAAAWRSVAQSHEQPARDRGNRQVDDRIAVLREREAHQAFLLDLNDRLRPLADPGEIQFLAARALGEHLGASRVGYAEAQPDGESIVVTRTYTNGVPGIEGGYRLDDFGRELRRAFLAGRTVIRRDIANDPTLSDAQRRQYANLQTGATVNVPLHKGGRFVAALFMHSPVARSWTAAELALLEAVAERTWDAVERARADQRLVASEARYRSVFEFMDQGFCIVDVYFDADREPVDYRFMEVNRVFEEQTGLRDPLGRTARELVPDLEEFWFETYGRVALTGEPTRFVDHSAPMGRWFDVNAFRIGQPRERRVAVLFTDITDRKRREGNLTFLAEVGDLFSRLSSSDEIMRAVGEKTGTHLGGSSSFLVDVDEERDEGRLQVIWTHAEAFPVPAVVRFSDFLSEELNRAARADQAIVVRDTQTDPRTNAQAYAALGIGSFVTIPFHRDGKWKFLFTLCDTRVRSWRDDEVDLMRELSHRTFPRLERARAEEQLRASEERFRTLIQRSSDAIQLVSREGTILNSFASVETVLGYAPEEIRGTSVAAYIHPADLAGVMEWLHGIAAAPNRVASRQYRVRHRNGLWIWVETAIANHLQTPNIEALVANFRNVSGRKAAEEALRDSEERFRTIVEEATDYAIFATDAQSRIQTWPPGAQAIFGWEAKEVVGKPFDITFTLDDRTAGIPAQESESARLSGIAPDVRWHLRKDDSLVFIEGSTYALRGPDGTLSGYFKIGRDVTERLRADEARRHEEERARQELETRVFAATAELRMLSRRLLEVHEEERRHLARELHDEIGQILTGLGLRLGGSGALGHDQLIDARHIVQQLTDQVRQLSMDLRPAALDSYGILPALQWHIERYRLQAGVRVDLRYHGVDRRFPAPVEITAYRIVQEALTNVARHAHAQVATVQLLAEGSILTVSVRDDGRGFDLHGGVGSSGLRGMRERVELLGGTIDIDAAPGAGVVVTAEIPLGDVHDEAIDQEET